MGTIKRGTGDLVVLLLQYILILTLLLYYIQIAFANGWLGGWLFNQLKFHSLDCVCAIYTLRRV